MTTRILSFDGGGRLGALSTRLLERLDDAALWRVPDVLAGTSTGSIIACALAVHMQPAELTRLYDERCGEIFQRSWLAGYGAKYTAEGLRAILAEKFAGLTLGALPCKVLIAACRLGNADPESYDEPVLFHNLGGPDATPDVTLVDACMASSAAPTYFPPHALAGRLYADGGLWANDPTIDAVALTTAALGRGLDTISTLSIGTGWRGYRSNPSWWGGQLQWLKPVLNFGIDATALFTDHRARNLLGQRYFRLNPALDHEIQMDDCSPDSIAYVRSVADAVDLTGARAWLRDVWGVA